MYILKNALKNLNRNKGRNALIGIIVLSMISSIAIAIIINSTTDGVIESYKERFGSEVLILYKTEKLNEYFNENPNNLAPTPTAKQYEEFSKSNKLKEVKFKTSRGVFATSIKAIGQENFEEYQNKRANSSNFGTIQNGAQITGGGPPKASEFPSFTITGYSKNNMPEDFTKKNTRKIILGKMFENDNECIISEELAKLNKLKIGDELKLSNKAEGNKDLVLKISGIYEEFGRNDTMMGSLPPAANSKNEIITNYNTLSKYQEVLDEKERSMFNTEATMFLKSPELLDEFKKELKSMGLSDDFEVSTDEYSYNKIVAPVNGLRKVSTMFMIGILIFGSIVLILLSLLSIRERKYEIGVLRAMGMSKGHLARGFIYESLLTISVCLVIGLGIGAVSAQPVSNMLLKEQIKVASQVNANGYDDYINIPNEEDEQSKRLEKLDVKLTSKSVIEITIIALVLGLITSSIAVFYATKYEPIKILSERN